MQDVTTTERLKMENETLRYEAAHQEQQIAAQAQKLEAVKGQEQQVAKLEQQVDSLHSKLKDEQKGKEAAVKVSSRHRSHQPLPPKLLYWLLSRLHMTTGFVTGCLVLASYLSLRSTSFCIDDVCHVSVLIIHVWPQKVGLSAGWRFIIVWLVWA